MKKFEELGLSKETLEVLNGLGFKEPTEIQEKAIPLALSGKDIIGGSATGSGKTLAFASPIIENLKVGGGIQALVLTPTRELAEQVATSIGIFSSKKKIDVCVVYGGVSIMNQMRGLRRADAVVGTPGRILDHMERGSLKFDRVKFLVLDEVDRMFDMGFLEDVERIIKACPKERQTMLFSATVSQKIEHLARKYTMNAEEVSVESYVDASKLTHIYYDTPQNLKFSLLVHLLREEKAELVMVFCSTRRNADFIANGLKREGVNAVAIHGGLAQNKRNRILEDFHEQGIKVLVCTDVAARGLDIKGVSHIYNYDIPKSSEEYIHRVGRTARAGKEGKAISILSARDYQNFAEVQRDDSLKIKEEKMPNVNFLRPKSEFRRDFGGRRFGGRDFGRREFGNRGRSFGGRDNRFGGGSRFGNRDSGGGRRDFRPRRDSRRDGRRPVRGSNYRRGR